ncbi:SCO family protein [Kiritimatiellota bacterium B12222]|nr:SCO family protein [Kiritimatiellota bacterium B12222]
MKYILTLIFALSTVQLHSADSCCAVTPATTAAPIYSDTSLFHLQASFLNTDGEKVTLSDYQGKPFILAMFYATCPTVCPRLIQDVLKMEDLLTASEQAQLPVILVSFDPETDSPEKLTAFAKSWEMDTPRWQLWSGNAKDARTLAAGLGIRYRKTPDGEISHSAPITLINAQGEIALQLAGPGVDNTALMQQIKTQLAAGAK